MMNFSGSDLVQIHRMAQEGSPGLLTAVGRFAGLGAGETSALTGGKIPWWTWLAFGAAVGFVGGARVSRRWPEKLPVIIRGE